MTSFTAVTTGNNTLATDINQYANALNGTTSAGVIVSGGASSFVPYTGTISAAPGSGDSLIFYAAVAADTTPRAGASIRSDGYGMFKVGAGSSVAANWYGQSGGWKTDQNVTIVGTLNVSGTATFVGIVATGTSSLDNGNITTSGGGTVNMAGTLNLTGSVPAMGFTNAHALTLQDTNGVFFQMVHDTVGGNNFTTLYNGFNTAGFGFKRQDGTKLAEFRANGNMTIAGTYQTGSFDAFDVAETFPCDTSYPAMTVLCPDVSGVLTRCAHDGCPCALIRPTSSGLELGLDENDPTQQTLALAGRVPAMTSTAVAARNFVCSDGTGGVRAMRSGEQGFALGFALASASQGAQVTVVLRGGYLTAP